MTKKCFYGFFCKFVDLPDRQVYSENAFYERFVEKCF